jgi:hypothetical protein
MNFNSKKISLLVISLGLLSAAQSAFGANITSTTSYQTFDALLAGIVGQAGTLITILGGLMIIIAGFLYLTSAGDEGRMKTAKSALMYAVGGIAVGLAAMAITNLVKTAVAGTDLIEIIKNIAKTVGTFMASVGVIMIIVAGIFYLLSAGDPAKIKKAKTTFIYAIVGIAIGLSATAIVSLLQQTFQ